MVGARDALSDPMRRALALADGVLGQTSPNPAVGAVLVRDGRVVGEGATAPPGGAHAEAAAIRAAGADARGATLYVTLEPCPLQGRTPPCTDAIRAAGIAEVVVAAGDADPRVDGRGLQALQQAGVAVRGGDGVRQAARHYAAYTHHRRSGRPYVIAKYAASLDGRIATNSGDAHWISGPEARAWSHTLRLRHDAILVGVATALQDDPQLTARGDAAVGARQPLRLVLDSGGRLPARARLLGDQEVAPTVIACTSRAPAAWRAAIEATGARVVEFPQQDGRVALAPLLDWLGAEGIVSLIVEGGGRVHGAFFDARLVQRVHAVIAPIVIGGAAAPAVAGTGADRLCDAVQLCDVSVRELGRDLLVTGSPVPPPPPQSVSVRPGAPIDAKALIALAGDATRRAALAPGLAADLAAVAEGTGAAWVAVAAGEVVGGLTLRGGGGQSGASAHWGPLLVADAWRNHGLAERLLEAAEASAAGRGCRWAVATVRADASPGDWTRADWAARGYRYYRPGADGALQLIREIASRDRIERRD